MGRTFEDDEEKVRATVGATYLAQLTHDVEQIKRLLSTPSK